MKVKLNILTYNVMIPIPKPFSINGQDERATKIHHIIRMIEKMKKIDVLVFQELVPDKWIKYVSEKLALYGFHYRSMKMQKGLSFNSGIWIFSKHKILTRKIIPFNECAKVDCWLSKGVSYISIEKKGKRFHIFGTHIQAWEGCDEIRLQQFHDLANFILSQNIPKKEPVLVAGDFNIDEKNDILKEIKYIADINIPPKHPKSHLYTWDPSTNNLVGTDDLSFYKNERYKHGCEKEYDLLGRCTCCPHQWFDYVCYSNRHKKPHKANMTSFIIHLDEFKMNASRTKRILTTHVSDHYPVLGEFEFQFKK